MITALVLLLSLKLDDMQHLGTDIAGMIQIINSLMIALAGGSIHEPTGDHIQISWQILGSKFTIAIYVAL